MSTGRRIIDLSCSSAAKLITRWKVAEDVETLSDYRHLLINFKLPRQARKTINKILDQRGERNSFGLLQQNGRSKKMDIDMLTTAAHIAAWPLSDYSSTAEEDATWLRKMLRAICNAAMPRARLHRKTTIYWWSTELEEK